MCIVFTAGSAGSTGAAARTARDDAVGLVREVDRAHDVLVRELVQLEACQRVPHARAEVRRPRHRPQPRVIKLIGPYGALRLA